MPTFEVAGNWEADEGVAYDVWSTHGSWVKQSFDPSEETKTLTFSEWVQAVDEDEAIEKFGEIFYPLTDEPLDFDEIKILREVPIEEVKQIYPNGEAFYS